jgi:opacity protein-like surface antigen
MRLFGDVLAVVVLFVLGAGVVRAQSYGHDRDIEVTPFGGTRFGGSIAFNPPATYTPTGGESSASIDSMSIKSSFDYGVLFDYGIWPGFQAEFMWNRQPTELHAHDANTGAIYNVGQANLDMYQWGALWELKGEEAKLKPFIAMGLGFTHLNTYGSLTGFSNRLAYNIGGGVKYEFAQHVGLRAEVRYSPTRTTHETGVVEDAFGDVYQTRITNHANQGQANIGVIVRF